jgi:hypothetical protein
LDQASFDRFAGLCRVDELTVYFEPLTASSNDARTPTRVVGLDSGSLFHFLHPPTSPSPDTISASEHAQADADCAHLNPETAHFVSARADAIAIKGVWLFDTVVAAASTANVPFALSCSFARDLAGSKCESVLASLKSDGIDTIDRCEISAGDDNSAECLDLSYDLLGPNTFDVRIVAKPVGSGEEVERVAVGETIVIRDERAD